MRKIHWLMWGLILSALIQAPASFADTDLENASLNKIIHVLDSLKPLINQADLQQDQSTRVQFNYAALREDIEKIKQGIRRKWQRVAIEPRPIQPIEGDYLLFRSRQA